MRNIGLQTAPATLPLDLGGPVPGMNPVPIPEMVMFGASPTPAFDGAQDAKIRSTRVVDPLRYGYPLAELNKEYLYELGTVYGHEGADSQNPYVWASRGVLAYDLTGPNSKLVASYGIGVADTADNVAMNAQATAGIMDV